MFTLQTQRPNVLLRVRSELGLNGLAMYKCHNVPAVYYSDYPVDLGFAIDSSIPDDMWSNALFYARAVTDSFDISSSRTRVGAIVFSDYARIAFPLNADYTRVGVQQLIFGMRQSDSTGQRIDRALQVAYRDLFSARYGARTGARQVKLRCLC